MPCGCTPFDNGVSVPAPPMAWPKLRTYFIVFVFCRGEVAISSRSGTAFPSRNSARVLRTASDAQLASVGPRGIGRTRLNAHRPSGRRFYRAAVDFHLRPRALHVGTTLGGFRYGLQLGRAPVIEADRHFACSTHLAREFVGAVLEFPFPDPCL